MRSTVRIAARVLIVCATGALTLASAGLAGQPVTQTLNPQPPAWQTCKAVGEGTICEGTVSFSYGPVDTGLGCGSGASAFDIFDSANESELARRFYDENGNLVRRVRHDRFTSGQLSNPLTGATLEYTQTQGWTDILAVPGDFGSATVTLSGEFVVHGMDGAPVLVGAGRTVFAPDFTIESQAGPSGFLDLLTGDPSAVGPLCAALVAT
jgi:hypothetical protein